MAVVIPPPDFFFRLLIHNLRPPVITCRSLIREAAMSKGRDPRRRGTTAAAVVATDELRETRRSSSI